MVPFYADPDPDDQGMRSEKGPEARGLPDWRHLNDDRPLPTSFAAEDFLVDEVDAALVARVAERLVAESEIRGRLVQVTVQNSVVILEGSVESVDVKRAAGRVAWMTPGVLDVCNMLVADG
jgi:hypothetical protein